MKAPSECRLKQTWDELGKNKKPQITILIEELNHENTTKTLSANIKKHLPQAVFLPAVKDLSDEIGNKKTAVFNQVIEKIIKAKLASDDEGELQSTYKKLQEAEEAFRNLLVDEKQSGFKVDTEKYLNQRVQQIIDVGVVSDYKTSESVDDFNLVSKVEMEIKDGNTTTNPIHQGHGAQRTLLLSLYEALATELASQQNAVNPEELIILVEEPEMYMHPQMARKMRDMLVDLARTQNVQVICTTHSPVFLDLADRHDGIVILQKKVDMVDVIQHTENLYDETEQRDRLRMLLNFDAAVNEVFFSDRVCLVEGDTELAAIESYAQKLINEDIVHSKKYWQKGRGVTVINCRGKWTIAAFQKVLNWFQIEYVIVHDKDNEDEDDGANAKILDLLGDDAKRLIHTKNFEDCIFKPEKEWKRDKPWKATQAIKNGDIADEEALKKFGSTRNSVISPSSSSVLS